MSQASPVLILSQLQNLIKRDPPAYREEFLLQLKHFESEYEVFKLKPSRDSERFSELVTFLSHIIPLYWNDSTISCGLTLSSSSNHVTKALFYLLENLGAQLHPDIRIKTFQALVLLRNRGVVDPISLISLCFKLFNIPDKSLRLALSNYIVRDVKTMNTMKRNDKVNKSIQAIMFNVVISDSSFTARKSVEILVELYRKKIWTDERTVNVLSLACTSPDARVMICAINFFLGIESKILEDEEVEKNSVHTEVNYHEHAKKTKKRARIVQRQVERNQKQARASNNKQAFLPVFPAIQLIRDPLTLAEKLLGKAKQSGERFEIKLLIMNFVSRIIGCHKLLLLGFYSFMQRYLSSHQTDVTQILAYLVQGIHDTVPPQEISPIIQTIASNFISERCSDETLTVGINSVREIINRIPTVLYEPNLEALVQDIAMYSRKMNKVVVSASKGMINLIREIYPALLRKQDRGRDCSVETKPLQYGERKTLSQQPDVDLEVCSESSGFEEPMEIDEEFSKISNADERENDDDEEYEEFDTEDDEEHDCLSCDHDAGPEARPLPKRLTKLFSDDDVDMIRRLKSHNSQCSEPENESEDSVDDRPSSDYVLSPETLMPSSKVRRSTKLERLSKIIDGKKENSKFEYGGHRGGLTNKEKERKKNFVMVRKGKRELVRKNLRSSQEVRYKRNHQKKVFGRDKRKRRRV